MSSISGCCYFWRYSSILALQLHISIYCGLFSERMDCRLRFWKYGQPCMRAYLAFADSWIVSSVIQSLLWCISVPSSPNVAFCTDVLIKCHCWPTDCSSQVWVLSFGGWSSEATLTRFRAQVLHRAARDILKRAHKVVVRSVFFLSQRSGPIWRLGWMPPELTVEVVLRVDLACHCQT